MKVDPQRHCPYCGSAEVFRSHRRGVMERYLLRAIAVRPYRCVKSANGCILNGIRYPTKEILAWITLTLRHTSI
jgi:hypothetical protein